jgi:type II secretory ATPase GspE/PulE/Tfp pilus assembly ATPase PilB-like protein
VSLASSLAGAFSPFDAVAWAAGASFPRGPGFYFSIGKLLFVLLAYAAWLATCAWVDEDSRKLGLPVQTWNAILFSAGLLGVLVFWLVPFFLIGFIVLLVLYLVPALTYALQRNKEVPPHLQVLTPQHFRDLARRYLRLDMGEVEDEDRRPIPIRFIAKTSVDEGESRFQRVEGTAGYRAALEMVHKAIELRATDIHMEPTREEMSVRLRIDGILVPAEAMSRQVGDSVINIFKVLANLDITEKRKPQDGSFGAEVATLTPSEKRARAAQKKKAKASKIAKAKGRRGDEEDDDEPEAPPAPPVTRQVDFRLATAGSVAGEKLVMRILDRSRQVTTLAQIGMRDKLREQVRAVVGLPHGMFIVCGPTGAGKSTTLYACLQEIDRYQKNVITLENPVEYYMENVTQIEVNPKAGKTFASELRSILRQDPDVIYIGEIRDQETAEIACQAAQTGHMVFTTLHANDTVTALGRLLDLGVQPFMVASAVSAILGQRLVRVLCPKCKQRYKPNPDMLRKANLPAEKIPFLYRPRGNAEVDSEDSGTEACKNCGATGYHGRTGVFELMVLTDKIREMIRDNPNLTAIRQEAVKGGMKYLQEDGLRQVIEGETSIQELLRVCK